ncbi:MAG: hypothetical protein ACI8TL_000705 [Natronomonas sp.]
MIDERGATVFDSDGVLVEPTDTEAIADAVVEPFGVAFRSRSLG